MDAVAAPSELFPLAEAERRRMQDLAAQSTRDSTVIVEMVYGDKWVRFDITDMQAGCLTYAQMGERIFEKAFRALGIDRSGATESSSSLKNPLSQE